MARIIKDRAGVCRLEQPGGRTLAWREESGVPLIQRDGFSFKDLARRGALLPYEDWRLDAWTRAKDLASRLSVPEIAGLMLYSPHQMVPPLPGGPFPGSFAGKSFEDSGAEKWALSDQQTEFLEKEHIRHVLLAAVASPEVSARWSNALQAAAEKLPFGIPVNISSDPRSGVGDLTAEFKGGAAGVSQWPEGLGFASCFDADVVRAFAEDASREYRAMGITTALGPQIDLCTEPRWMRLQDTLGADLERVKQLVKAYCDGMQTTKGETSGWGMDSVNTMVKHFPGGGTGEGGRDAHYPFGKFAVYPGNNFDHHMRPFTEAAFRLDGPTLCASAVMPYYTVSWGVDPENVGNAYSEKIVKDLLRGKCGYRGVVCTDWGITQDPLPDVDSFSSRCYGVERLTEAQRCLRLILNGVDQFGGSSKAAPVLEAYRLGCGKIGEEAMRARFEESTARLLNNIFHCGLFEDPYLDPERTRDLVGCAQFRAHGMAAQRKSVVLLKNKGAVLPLKRGLKVYVPDRAIRPAKGFFRNDLPARTEDPLPGGLPEEYGIRVDTPQEADVALVFAESPLCNPYSAFDAAAGSTGYRPITLQYRKYTASTARAESVAGGDFREDFVNRSYRNRSNIAYNESDLDNILMCRRAMGARPVIVCLRLHNPMVMAEFERQADGIIAEFGVSRTSVLDAVFGAYRPTGKLPVQLPANMETVEAHREDMPFDLLCHVDEAGNAYDFGFGLTYAEEGTNSRRCACPLTGS